MVSFLLKSNLLWLSFNGICWSFGFIIPTHCCFSSSHICSPNSGEFSGENIRLGSRGDSYYEYLLKVWLQHRESNLTYIHDMYEEAMKGVRHLLVQKSIPNGLVFVGELPYGRNGAFSPKMDHLVCGSQNLFFPTLVHCFTDAWTVSLLPTSYIGLFDFFLSVSFVDLWLTCGSYKQFFQGVWLKGFCPLYAA